jgi:hypothetical protein
MSTLSPSITSTEPRIHYANSSVLISNSSEVTNKSLADTSTNTTVNQTSIDEELGTVTEQNLCPTASQNLYLYVFMLIAHVFVSSFVHFRPQQI